MLMSCGMLGACIEFTSLNDDASAIVGSAASDEGSI